MQTIADTITEVAPVGASLCFSYGSDTEGGNKLIRGSVFERGDGLFKLHVQLLYTSKKTLQQLVDQHTALKAILVPGFTHPY